MPVTSLTPKMELAQDRLGRPIRGWLRDAVKRGWSPYDISHELYAQTRVRITGPSVLNWLDRLGIAVEEEVAS